MTAASAPTSPPPEGTSRDPLVSSPGWRQGRGPFVVVGLTALPALGVLAAAAPGGALWRWLEFPFGVTAIAVALGAWAMWQRSRSAAWVVLLGTPGLWTIWAFVDDYRTFQSIMAQHLIPEGSVYRAETDLLLRNGLQCLAPWALGAAFGVLAALSITRRQGLADAHDRNVVRAGGWLLVTAVAAGLCASVTDSWITLETLSGNATVRASGGLPDTKALTLGLASCAAVVGAVLLAGAGARRRRRRRFLAGIGSDGAAGAWTVVTGADEELPQFLDPSPPARGVLVRRSPGASGAAFRDGEGQRVANVP